MSPDAVADREGGLPGAPGKRVVVIGLGATGSHLLPHLARMSDVSGVTLIDHDRYDGGNVRTQSVDLRDVGRAKVEVQAERAWRIRPELDVTTIPEPVERIPLGLLRADVILTCVDGRRARQWVNACAWRLGVPWVDSGVDAGGLLARVDTYAPAAGAPCMECSWGPAEYRSLEQRYPCAPGPGGARPADPTRPPTDSPSYLAALAAAVQARAARRVLDGGGRDLRCGRVVFDLDSGRAWKTTLRANPDCRFDHQIWDIQRSGPSPDDLTLAQAFALATAGQEARLGMEGELFLVRAQCPSCGRDRSLLYLSRRVDPASLSCPACGAEMVYSGFGVVPWLDPAKVEARGSGAWRLRDVGLKPGDVVTVGTDLHVELGGHHGG